MYLLTVIGLRLCFGVKQNGEELVVRSGDFFNFDVLVAGCAVLKLDYINKQTCSYQKKTDRKKSYEIQFSKAVYV